MEKQPQVNWNRSEHVLIIYSHPESHRFQFYHRKKLRSNIIFHILVFGKFTNTLMTHTHLYSETTTMKTLSTHTHTHTQVKIMQINRIETKYNKKKYN